MHADEYNARELDAGRITTEHYRYLCPRDMEIDVPHLTQMVRQFQIRWGMVVDAQCGPKTRMGINACLIPRRRPMDDWNGLPFEVSSPFADPRSDGPHRGADWMIRMVGGIVVPADWSYRDRWFWPPDWPIRCVADGEVTAVSRLANGCWIKVRHPYRVVTQYGHLGEPSVMVGDEVVAGQVLALVADRKRMWPRHLHMGAQYGWAGGVIRGYQDPMLWL